MNSEIGTISTMSEKQNPTIRAVVRRWRQSAKDNKSRLLWLLKVISVIGIVSWMMAEEAFGAAYGYNNEAECWADTRYTETQGTGAAKAFRTELAELRS